MKIAVLDMLFNWPPDGGARVDVKEVFSRLAQTHDVHLFVPAYDLILNRGQITAETGFPVTSIPFSPWSFNRWGIRHKFRKALDRFKPDIVFVTDGWHVKPWAAEAARDYPTVIRFYAYECMCLRQNGIFMRGDRPCYKSHLGNFFTEYPACNACAIKSLVRRKLSESEDFLLEYLSAGTFLPTYPAAVKRMLRRARRVIVYNDLQKYFVQTGTDQIVTIPGGYNPDIFPQKPYKPGKPVRIGMPGRTSDPHKGYVFLRQVFSKLMEYDLDEEFEFSMTGELPHWNPEIPGLRYTGWHTQTQLSDFYADMDIIVVPSLWQEPFGMVALEAMATGRPVVVSKVGGLQNIVESDKTGYVVDPTDADAWAGVLAKLIRSPELRESLGRAGAVAARTHYTWDTIVDRYYEPLLNELVS